MFPCELPPLFSKVILLMWKGGGETCPFLNVLHVIFLFCPIFFRSTVFFQTEHWPLFFHLYWKSYSQCTALWDTIMCESTPSKDVFFVFSVHYASAALIRPPRAHPSAAVAWGCGRNNTRLCLTLCESRVGNNHMSLQQPPFCPCHSCLLWPVLLQRCRYVNVFSKIICQAEGKCCIHLPSSHTPAGCKHRAGAFLCQNCGFLL